MGSRMPFRHLFTCRRAGWRRRLLAAPLWWLSASLLLISAAVLWQPGRSFQQAALQAAEDGRGGREEEGGSCPTLGTVPWGCQHLRRVCLDQGQAVLHRREYQPSQASAARPPRRLPSWSPRVDDNFPYPTEGGSNPDYLTAPGLPQPQPPLTFRPVSAAEPTPDLASPQWSCQVPLILQTVFLYNYAHMMGNTASWLFSRLVAPDSAQQLAERAQVAVATPWALGLTAWARALLQPMARHPVTTLADLSSRGNHTRCFADLLLCEQPHHWDAELAYQASQHTVEYWRSSWSVQQPNIIWHSATEAASSAGRSGTRTRHGQRPGRTWRVLFQTRTDAVRQLTNLQQLLDHCSNWQYTDPATGQVHRAQCGVWPVTAAPEVIAVAQMADIAIGTHGANTANALFMRPGSALIEIFHPDWNHQFVRHWLESDPMSQVHWWGVVVEDRELFSPGAHEQRERQEGGLPYKGHWNAMMRDRNLKLPWDVLRGVLDRIAAVNGSVNAYRKQVASGSSVVKVPSRGLLPVVRHWFASATHWLKSVQQRSAGSAS